MAGPFAALHRLLREAAANEFAGVSAEDLPERFASRLDELLARGGDDDELLQLRRQVARFPDYGRHDRMRIVARGLRLCLQQASRQAAPRARVRRRDLSPDSVASLSGVGPKTAEKLAMRGITTLSDLASLLPIGYQDRRHRTAIDNVEEGQLVVLEGFVAGFRQGRFRGRFMATLELDAKRSDGETERVQARWFHYVGGLAQRAQRGAEVLLIGQVKRYKGRWSMVHPELHDVAGGTETIAVRYPVVEGVGKATLARLCRAAVEALSSPKSGFRDVLPAELVTSRGLPTLIEALSTLHDPPQDIEAEQLDALSRGTSPAHRRMAFEELFFQQLGRLRQRQQWRSAPSIVGALPQSAVEPERLRACVPFELTAAQWRSVREINDDLVSGQPMLRLLQGDVGSGKTVVAFAAAVAVADGGGQIAIMAPTEILAEQHLRTLRQWCEAAGLSVALLTGSTPRTERESRLALLAAGKIDVLVGTHALLFDRVRFARLGLAVIDEQHRFGVEQRALLRDKGASPNLLVMTATPIPRTLALTLYGELDVSVIDELPPGRQAPTTRGVYGRGALDRARRELAKQVAAGAQAFVVCPLVEKSDAIDVSDVEAAARALRPLLPGHVVEVIHGRMLAKEKDAVMTRFRNKDVQVLVATTVIEVGVDVPDARAILVEHAERFGLAQLHQLRGRVGRGTTPSSCLLHTAQARDSDAGRRLQALERTANGFELAERDLELRGPGEVFGTRQAGAPNLRLLTMANEGPRLLLDAREAAAALLAQDPTLDAHSDVRSELEHRQRTRELFTGEGG